MGRTCRHGTDGPAVKPHGSHDAVLEKILQEEETVASNGREMIDDFRLWGSRSWRRSGGPLIKGGWSTQVVHYSGNHSVFLSEGGALAAVVGALPGKPY